MTSGKVINSLTFSTGDDRIDYQMEVIKMKRIEISVGQEFDKHNRPMSGLEYKRKAALKTASELFGGCSASFVSGGWINPYGQLVEEQSLVIIIYTDKSADVVLDFAELLGDLFSQQSVVVASMDANVVFVS